MRLNLKVANLKFQKLPIVVEAEQFLIGQPLPFAKAGQLSLVVQFCAEQQAYFVVTVHDQWAYLADGDWVILEAVGNGRAYPCKPDVFAATYRPADSAARKASCCERQAGLCNIVKQLDAVKQLDSLKHRFQRDYSEFAAAVDQRSPARN